MVGSPSELSTFFHNDINTLSRPVASNGAGRDNHSIRVRCCQLLARAKGSACFSFSTRLRWLGWENIGGSRGGARGVIFLDQSKARRVEKIIWRPPPASYHRVCMTAPPPPPPYLKVQIRHWRMTLFHGTIFLHAYGVWMKFLCCWKTGSRNSLLLNLRYSPLMYLESFHSRHLRWFDGTFLKKKGKKVFIVVCVSNFKSHLVYFRSVPPRYPGYTDTSDRKNLKPDFL